MVRLLLSEVNPGAAEALAEQLTIDGGVEIVGFARDGLEAAQLIAQVKPDVAIIHASLPGLDGFRAVQMGSLVNPETACILLVEGNGDSRTRAMRSGARAAVPLDTPVAQIRQLIEDLSELSRLKQEPEYDIITDPNKMPVTLAVTGAKGGIGKTTTAVNLALCFAKQFTDQVVLVDFFGQFGDIALLLDLPVNGNIGDLAGFTELDLNLVERHLSTHPSGLRVLAAPSAKSGMAGVGNADVHYLASLLGLLRRKYRFVIFDIPPLVGEASGYVFLRCMFVLVIATLHDLAVIRDTADLLAMLDGQRVPPQRVKLIANQEGDSRQFTTRDLAEATGHKVFHRIPFDAQSVVRAVNEGIPISIGQPSSPLGRAYDELRAAILRELPK
jgi:pilus assembly protein CpaE